MVFLARIIAVRACFRVSHAPCVVTIHPALSIVDGQVYENNDDDAAAYRVVVVDRDGQDASTETCSAHARVVFSGRPVLLIVLAAVGSFCLLTVVARLFWVCLCHRRGLEDLNLEMGNAPLIRSRRNVKRCAPCKRRVRVWCVGCGQTLPSCCRCGPCSSRRKPGPDDGHVHLRHADSTGGGGSPGKGRKLSPLPPLDDADPFISVSGRRLPVRGAGLARMSSGTPPRDESSSDDP